MSSLALSLSLLAFSVTADSGAETNSYARFARLALDCLHREYPNKIAHVLQGDRDAKPPRELTPVFFGCFDWKMLEGNALALSAFSSILPGVDF